jgi:hypothetical protein
MPCARLHPCDLHVFRSPAPGPGCRIVTRAFGNAFSEAGGSLPVWLVLLNLKTRRLANQHELAEAVGVREATLTSLTAITSQAKPAPQPPATSRAPHEVTTTVPRTQNQASQATRDPRRVTQDHLRPGSRECQGQT